MGRLNTRVPSRTVTRTRLRQLPALVRFTQSFFEVRPSPDAYLCADEIRIPLRGMRRSGVARNLARRTSVVKEPRARGARSRASRARGLGYVDHGGPGLSRSSQRPQRDPLAPRVARGRVLHQFRSLVSPSASRLAPCAALAEFSRMAPVFASMPTSRTPCAVLMSKV